MQPRRILSSASNASRQLAPPLCAQLNPALAGPGPSRFPGCLESPASGRSVAGPPLAASPVAPSSARSPSLQARTARHLDFLYPPSISRRPASCGTALSSNLDGRRAVSQIRQHSSLSFYDASFPPTHRSQSAARSDSTASDQPANQEQQQEQQPNDVSRLTDETRTASPKRRTGKKKSSADSAQLVAHAGLDSSLSGHKTGVKVDLRPSEAAELQQSGSSDSMTEERLLPDVQAAMLAGDSSTAAKLLSASLIRIGWTPASDIKGRQNGENQRPGSGQVAQPTKPSATMDVRAVEAIASLCERLMVQLTARGVDRRPRPAPGSPNEAHRESALHLWEVLRHFRVPRTSASQLALIQWLLRDRQRLKAARVYATELRAWWNVYETSAAAGHRRPSQADPMSVALERSRPSGALLHAIQRDLARLEAVLASPAAPGPQISGRPVSIEYGEALLSLCQLLVSPPMTMLPPDNSAEIAWIISAACRYDRASQHLKPKAGSAADSAAAESVARKKIGKAIRGCMRSFIRQLASEDFDGVKGQPRPPKRNTVAGRAPPKLSMSSYNQLLFYCLKVLRSTELCHVVFAHLMASRDRDGLEPDHVTINTMLRQATINRLHGLANSILAVSARQARGAAQAPPAAPQAPRVASHGTPPDGVAAPAVPSSPRSAAPASSTSSSRRAENQTMLSSIDDAIRRADSYRLHALISLVASSGSFLRRHRGQPSYISIRDLVARVYPRLVERSRKSPKPPPAANAGATDTKQPQAHADWDAASLRPRIGRQSRFAIYEPHVLTAVLNLVAKAGKTGLALRIWRMIRHFSRQSQVTRRQVSEKPWMVPTEAATILFQTLAAEGRKSMKVFVPRGRARSFQRRRPPRYFGASPGSRQIYAVGWALDSSIPQAGRGAGSMLRCQAARLVAMHEYWRLLERWNLAAPLAKATAAQKCPGPVVLPSDGSVRVPDSRFYDALLDLFGRRAGMRGRTPTYRSRSDWIHRTRKAKAERDGKRQALRATVATETRADVAVAASGAKPAPLQPTSTSADLAATGVAPFRRLMNSRGRWTDRPPKAFLLVLLKHMRALGIEIPLAYRWLLEEGWQAPQGTVYDTSPSTDDETPRWGRFSAFRGPRTKTVGLPVQSRSSERKK
ncbi:uncharacterized protein PFL1_06764 [Pseudozyma flocculosa PF-1]|uniref:Uncharacterized protein n=2 Tax=Pseudozyma flocculosa TaxID=84751 RepID=A0A5C3F7L9_9BASI|nr:uncharacterized protein PFL1_06764 [Pseudozyma flocculosa PF-1]EPQ25692.1 hypothetical protein PFL1_06764 [Pseudozyma flocculosa PF-1]SPO40468.1 uncharacterized protein PSFLO_05950 [Pseudozyma flocculosa]